LRSCVMVMTSATGFKFHHPQQTLTLGCHKNLQKKWFPVRIKKWLYFNPSLVYHLIYMSLQFKYFFSCPAQETKMEWQLYFQLRLLRVQDLTLLKSSYFQTKPKSLLIGTRNLLATPETSQYDFTHVGLLPQILPC